jgi:hypothetical protein
LERPLPNSGLRHFRPEPIPEAGLNSLRTLVAQKKFLDSATVVDSTRRARGLRNYNDNWFEARRPPPARLNPKLMEKEVSGCERYAPRSQWACHAVNVRRILIL